MFLCTIFSKLPISDNIDYSVYFSMITAEWLYGNWTTETPEKVSVVAFKAPIC